MSIAELKRKLRLHLRKLAQLRKSGDVSDELREIADTIMDIAAAEALGALSDEICVALTEALSMHRLTSPTDTKTSLHERLEATADAIAKLATRKRPGQIEVWHAEGLFALIFSSLEKVRSDP